MNAFEQPAESTLEVSAEKTSEERKQLLAQGVQQAIQRGRGHVESQSDFQATLVKGHRPNHILHLLLSIVTLGLWIFVWVAVAVFGGEKRWMVSVDSFGNTHGRSV